MSKKGKKYIAAFSKVDKSKFYSIEDAISLLKEIKFVKFDETIDISINLNLKKNHTVRDTIVLPNQFMKPKEYLFLQKAIEQMKLELLVQLMLEMMILLIRLKVAGMNLMLLLQLLI